MAELAQVSSLREIGAQEGVDNSYVSRMMNLTVLSPDFVEAILDDTLPDHLTLFEVQQASLPHELSWQVDLSKGPRRIGMYGTGGGVGTDL